MAKIITVSREFGSAGRTIGRLAAEKLGIPCYDQEIITRIAKDSGYAEDYIKEAGEYAASGSWFSAALAGRDQYGHSMADDIWEMQRKIILEIADQGPCVIVGRCADYILGDRDDMVSVFIHASLESRAKRIVEAYGETDVPAVKRLKEKDKRRKTYFQLYTDTKWGEAGNYDVCLDSGRLGIDKCVDIICGLYE